MDGWMAAKVYKLSIGAACELEWPSERFMIQVLDDSTDPVVKPSPSTNGAAAVVGLEQPTSPVGGKRKCYKYTDGRKK
ncbi:hypothetical protein Zm00014a_015551 [Zea mays]|uniref:Uncharacterized protein n=2 Tax=Zea mays TaxID=4577 RepID=A0A8J8Y295_MAIZE|nr:putative mannan synthase 7 [Zea mays]PWZ29398.1 hypothetical protein Zm00014a_015551 [Zea mays]